LIEARTARNDPSRRDGRRVAIPASSSVETPPARNPFRFGARCVRGRGCNGLIPARGSMGGGLSVLRWKVTRSVSGPGPTSPISRTSNAQRQTSRSAPESESLRCSAVTCSYKWVKSSGRWRYRPSPPIWQGYVHLTTGSDVLLPEARAYLSPRNGTTPLAALAARQSASPRIRLTRLNPSTTAIQAPPPVYPARHPRSDSRSMSAVACPQWIAATIVKVAGGKQ